MLINVKVLAADEKSPRAAVEKYSMERQKRLVAHRYQ
jgi:hypothetical protein